MVPDKSNPGARAAAGARECVKLGSSDVPEDSEPLADLQQRHLERRFHVNAVAAAVVASLVFGEAAR